jgi:ATP synthase F1 epsilon subunit
MNTIRVDVVSAEESIFSGEARFVALPGEAGELGIYPRHTPLISRIKAGSVRIEKNRRHRRICLCGWRHFGSATRPCHRVVRHCYSR